MPISQNASTSAPLVTKADSHKKIEYEAHKEQFVVTFGSVPCLCLTHHHQRINNCSSDAAFAYTFFSTFLFLLCYISYLRSPTLPLLLLPNRAAASYPASPPLRYLLK